jgi:hypothetical protein
MPDSSVGTRSAPHSRALPVPSLPRVAAASSRRRKQSRDYAMRFAFPRPGRPNRFSCPGAAAYPQDAPANGCRHAKNRVPIGYERPPVACRC